MHKDLFRKIGFTQVQSDILDTLLQKGELKASNIGKIITRPRGVVYKGLDELISLGLVEKQENEGEIARFRAEHPTRLENYFENKEKALKKSQTDFQSSLPDLISSYNLGMNKPGVKFLEGKEGFKKILNDSLLAEEVLLFINSKAMEEEKEFHSIDSVYREYRQKSKTKKRVIEFGIRPSKDYTEKFSTDYQELTKIKYTQKENLPFKASLQIYSNKISYQIINNGQMISVLIEDPHIFNLHKATFEFVWESIY